MKILRSFSCALLLGPVFGAHADYSWELAGAFDHAERSPDFRRQSTDELDSDLVTLSATYHFAPVVEGSGPIALAAFFDPRTQLSVAAGEGDTTDRFFGGPNSFVNIRGEEEVSDYSLRGLYVFPKSKWYAGGRYERHDGERRSSRSSVNSTGSGTDSNDVQDYALFAGKYFGAGATRLELSLEQSTEQTEGSSTICSLRGSCSTVTFSGAEGTSDSPRLAVMHVGRIRSATYALMGDISEERFPGLDVPGFDVDPPRTYFVGAELYPVPTIGVRLGYERLDYAGTEDDTASVGASWFVRRNVGLELTLSRLATHFTFPIDEPVDTNRAVLRVIGRL